MKPFSLAACVLGATLTLTNAEAAQCPSGQIYRVSKGVCVSKAEFNAFIKKGPAKKPVSPVKEAVKPATDEADDKPAVKIATKINPKVAPQPVEDSKEPPREYFPATPEKSAYSAPVPAPSPFGTLTPALSMK